jgi:DNA helicase-2/ATP-dependent DNA helicase PcrA
MHQKAVKSVSITSGDSSVREFSLPKRKARKINYENNLTAAEKNKLSKRRKSVKYNPQQKEAIDHDTGPMLVLAGAGSGKTSVVAARVGKLVENGRRPERILCVTFTNDARSEMEVRCKKLLSCVTDKYPTVLTLHGVGLRILRQYPEVVGYKPDLKIVSDQDLKTFLQKGLQHKSISDEVRARLGTDRIGAIQSKISLWKSDLKKPEDVLNDPCVAAYSVLQYLLRSTGRIECDDMPMYGAEILQKHGPALQHWQNRFDYIMVDEYQDTNKAQFELVSLLARGHGNLFVVGDDDQSIYGWRGADVSNIREFETHWPGAEMVTLDRNYRSTQPILDLSNQLMTHEKGRHQKLLVADKKGGTMPQVRMYNTDEEERLSIKEQILESDLDFDDIAVILRNQSRAKFIADVFPDEDPKLSIPHELVFDDTMQLGETKRNVYAIFKATHDPNGEEPSFIQLLEASSFSLPGDDYEKLSEIRHNDKASLWQIISSDKISILSEKAQEKLLVLKTLIDKFHPLSTNPTFHNPLSKTARTLMNALYPNYKTKKADDADQYTTETLRSIFSIEAGVERFEKWHKKPTFKTYLGSLERISKESKKTSEHKTKGVHKRKGRVRFYTVHGCKGLEFPLVFMPSMNEGILPSKQSIESDDPKRIAEERRLAYVGMTRAKDDLRMSSCMYKGRITASNRMDMSRYMFQSGADCLLSPAEQRLSDPPSQKRFIESD